MSEGEQEEQWLADAGLSTLISEDSGDIDNVVLLSTLTRTQAEAVQRRIDSYTLSLRKRNKPAPRDVRDIFNSPITQVRTEDSVLWELEEHKQKLFMFLTSLFFFFHLTSKTFLIHKVIVSVSSWGGIPMDHSNTLQPKNM